MPHVTDSNKLPEILFAYLRPPIAIEVLQQRRVQFSSPVLYNDPFEQYARPISSPTSIEEEVDQLFYRLLTGGIDWRQTPPSKRRDLQAFCAMWKTATPERRLIERKHFIDGKSSDIDRFFTTGYLAVKDSHQPFAHGALHRILQVY